MSYDSGRILNPIGGGSWLFANLPVGTAAATIPAGTQAYCSDLQTTCVYNGTSWLPFNNTSNNVGGLVAGSTSAAAANTALIQAALNNGGSVSINQAGTFYVTSLTYYSNTQLALGANTTLIQAPNNNQMMLQSGAAVAWLNNPVAVTLTWSAGVTCSVAWANHGLTAGQAVSLFGSTPSVFNGTFRVQSVTDANDFVIVLRYPPSAAPTGTCTAVVATQNFVLTGGTWDYNYANNSAGGQSRNRLSLLFECVADVIVRRVNSQNSSKYAFCSFASLNLTFEDCVVPYNRSDGLKIYGPAYDTYVNGLSGVVGDDGCTVQTNAYISYAAYQLTNGGDCWNVRVNNISFITPDYIGAIYVSDSEQMHEVVFDGVAGYSSGEFGFFIGVGDSYTVGQFGKVTLRNYNAAGAAGANLSDIVVGLCTGDIINVQESTQSIASVNSASSYFFQTQSTANVGKITLDGIDLNQPTLPASTIVYNTLFQHTGEIVTFKNVYQKPGTGNDVRMFNWTSTALKTLQLENCRSSAATLGLLSSAVTNNPLIKLQSCNFEGNGLLNIQAACRVAVSGGCRWTNATLGVIRTTGTFTVSLSSDGTTDLVAGSWFTVVSGTLTLNVYGYDITLSPNPSGTLQTGTGRGQYCTSTSSGANMAGPAIYTTQNGWLAVGTGAAGVNTAITT